MLLYFGYNRYKPWGVLLFCVCGGCGVYNRMCVCAGVLVLALVSVCTC